jgi:drug/metabolite transporter (DMT)-like permease
LKQSFVKSNPAGHSTSISWREIALLNLAMVFISTSGGFGRSLSIDPVPAIFWRSVVAVLALGGWCIYRKYPLSIVSKRSRLIVIVSGLLMTLHWVTYFYALAWSNVTIAMISVFTYPAITTILEPLFLKTRFQPIHLLLGAMILAGVFLMAPSLNPEDEVTAGIIMGLISATLYSIRNILMKTQVSSLNGSVLMGYQAGIAVILLAPFVVFSAGFPPASDWGTLAALGLVTTTLGHTLFLSSFRYFSVSTASLMSSVQPVYGILFGYLWLGEVPGWFAVFGGSLILASVVIEAVRKR